MPLLDERKAPRPSAGGETEVKHLALCYITVKNGSAPCNTVLQFHKNLNLSLHTTQQSHSQVLPRDMKRTGSRKSPYAHVHRSFPHHLRTAEATQMSFPCE